MKKYTVVLLRSPELCEILDAEYPDYYVACRLEAEDVYRALDAARAEAVAADAEETADPPIYYVHGPREYGLVVAFEGHLDPVLYSFQEWAR